MPTRPVLRVVARFFRLRLYQVPPECQNHAHGLSIGLFRRRSNVTPQQSKARIRHRWHVYGLGILEPLAFAPLLLLGRMTLF